MEGYLVTAVEYLVILSLVGAQVLDIYAVMIRARVNVDGTTQVLAVANWVQYLARILNMISVFGISILLEKKLAIIGVPELFGYSMFIGLFVILFVCLSRYACAPLRVLQVLGFTGVFGTLGKKPYWWRVKFNFFNKVTFFSSVVGILINLAIIMPFVLSVKYPDIRMTLAYTGQLLNFCASIIMFTYVDKVFFRALDEGNEVSCASSIIAGKVVSQGILVLGVIVVFLSIHDF